MKIKQWRAELLTFLAHRVGLPYFKLIRKRPSFPYSEADLKRLPEESVGYQLYQFFDKHQLELLPYYEKHDIKHIVLDYLPNEEGEVCLQTFMLANGRVTIPILIAVAYGWMTMPEFYSSFLRAWKRGRANQSLSKTNWIALVNAPLHEVKNALLVPR